jgi:CubicO group peptidase (beta-lactamase class C family)
MLLIAGCTGAPPQPVSPRPAAAAVPSAPASAAKCEPALRKGEPRRLTKEGLAKLAEAAKETDTDALVVVERGRVVLEYGKAQKRIELMSVTKSVASLLIGQLVDRGLVRLEQPVADFVPAWKGTPKEKIRLVHVLGHTSGLADKPTTEDIYASGDFVQFAIDAEVKRPPGEAFFYSNRATNLLARVVQAAAGAPIDEWARKNLFEPLGIRDFEWTRDKAGNPHVMAGLELSALDLARIGQLVLDRGYVCKKSIVSGAWLSTSMSYQKVGFSPHGLLWWLEPRWRRNGFPAELFDGWRQSGMPEEFTRKFLPLQGKYFESKGFWAAVYQALVGKPPAGKPTDAELGEWHRMTWESGRHDGEQKLGPVRAVVADGYGGQLLVVYPEKRVVVARLRVIENAQDAKEKKGLQGPDPGDPLERRFPLSRRARPRVSSAA